MGNVKMGDAKMTGSVQEVLSYASIVRKGYAKAILVWLKGKR